MYTVRTQNPDMTWSDYATYLTLDEANEARETFPGGTIATVGTIDADGFFVEVTPQ